MKLWNTRILIRIGIRILALIRILVLVLILVLLLGVFSWLSYTVRLKQTQTPQAGPGPSPTRGSVELPDGTFTFRLDYAAFQAEFPQLQSYRCRELIPGDGVCTGPPGPPLLLLAVKSHPASNARRATARRTWARPRLLGGYRVRPVFLVGVSPDPRDMALLGRESNFYGDVVLWDFTESHHNLSLKERCFLRWVGARCGQAGFIFKGDDDEFVNPAALVAYLGQTPNASHVIHGNIQHHSVVMREGKYHVSSALFPQDKYPFFPSGGGFVMPRASVPALAAASERIPVFPLDDVYFGFLALAAVPARRAIPGLWHEGRAVSVRGGHLSARDVTGQGGGGVEGVVHGATVQRDGVSLLLGALRMGQGAHPL